MSATHEWILLLILLVMMSAFCFCCFIAHALGEAVREKIADRPRRRLFVASVSFFLTFATVRGMVFAITHNIPPFHYVIVEGRHIHHLVFGIVILLLVVVWVAVRGREWQRFVIHSCQPCNVITIRIGRGSDARRICLWLNLKDVYFVREGRSSIDAVVLFGSLLAVSAWGAPLFSLSENRQANRDVVM